MIPDEAPLGGEPLAGIGHNRTLAEQMRDELERLLEPYAEQRDRYLRNAQNAIVRDRGTVGASASVLKLGGEIWDEIETARLKLSNPLRDITDSLGRQAREFWSPVEDEFSKLRQKISAWHDEEDKRIADEAAEQDAIIAQMREKAGVPEPAPAVPQPVRASAPIYGDLGGKVTRVEHTDYEITDVTKLPRWLLESPGVKEAILKVVRRTAKATGVVPEGIVDHTSKQTRIS